MSGQSFRFEQTPPFTQPSSNHRYDKLQQMLSQAKKNNLDMFYRNLDQHNAYSNEDKFTNKQQFVQYRNELKNVKRNREDQFYDRNGNYNFRENHYNFPQRDSDNPFLDSDFKKKTNGGGAKPVAEQHSGNLLPQEYEKEDEDIDFFDLGEE
jgi:hypothetical protein